ncbi:oligomeric Golgi complex subunit 8, partial [Gaertneriomyces semiglobifer]
YLDYLCSSSLQTLKAEPAALREEGDRIQKQLAELVYTEYRSFLKADECTRTSRTALGDVADRCDGVVETLTDLSTACAEFPGACSDIVKDQKRNRILLNHQETLLELLEIPHLMQTFVRNGYYEEAMDLQAYVGRLIARHPGFSFLSTIQEAVEESTKVMQGQLIASLKGDVKLPTCIKVIGFLRRASNLPPHQLRIVFLRQRDSHLQQRLREGRSENHAELLKMHLDVYRDFLLDIVYQFRAIFPSSDTPTDANVLPSYITHRINNLLHMLSTHVPHLDSAQQIASVHSQVTYLSHSLTRVGLDFGGLSTSLFTDGILRLVNSELECGFHDFLSW